MENNVVLFEQKYLEKFKKLGELKKAQKELETIEKQIKSELETAMDEFDVHSIKNEYVTISRVAPAETISIDLEKLKEAEPDCYKGLIEDYPKVTKKKGYVKIVVK